ncbi:SCO1664 family protein [Nakamurella sp. YIM 132087]|uniref:SCO1664 family protein n=1 Tax=Nakamurella alba TaxID=2665158 RepID=A0A7K1FIK6_9ACTN|nr:SCO1664 family protein [Nakamurella alba]
MEVLTLGDIEVDGRVSEASNLTLVGTVTLGDIALTCVYKPVRGERPLWDFPDGTLAQREYGAYLVAAAAGWDCVPPTVLRPGPFGAGMVQLWIDTPAAAGDGGELVDLVAIDDIPRGWKPVLNAIDTRGADVAVVHADEPALAVLAGFDLVVNNADRKGSHVLAPGDGRVLGVDHGLCFHQEDKLRTILWGWAGQPLPEPVVDGLRRLDRALQGELGEQLDELLTVRENSVLRKRIAALRHRPEFPEPPRNRTPIPWPPL